MRKIFLSAIASLVLLTGCTTITEAGYYWGDYSATLYAYTKDPSDETLSAHEAELNNIVTVSSEQNLQVPPGINAELGYINAAKGNDGAAKAYYQTEMQNYPESQLFLERLTAANPKES